MAGFPFGELFSESREDLFAPSEKITKGSEGQVDREGNPLCLRRQLKELVEETRILFDLLVELIAAPEVAGCLGSPLFPEGLARGNSYRAGHHEHQLVRLLLDRQGPEFCDLPLALGGGKSPNPLTLKNPASAVLPTHNVASAFTPALTKMLNRIKLLFPDEPQAEALELSRRELVERECLGRTGSEGLCGGSHCVVARKV
ncbi:MAG TPA: hypothetical protein VN851_04185 [Thermoanaerobaculia bacterium]|nr:hypothetical protein [Thermoanaerobaculia bacterium]